MRRILLVEDDPTVMVGLLRTLGRSGWEPTGVPNGHAALAVLATQDFDAVLSDLALGPGPNAIEILRRMPPRNRGKRFVIMTGQGTQGQCREAFLCGAADFIEKPIRFGQLLASLDMPTVSRDSDGQERAGTTVGGSGGTTIGLQRIRSIMRQLEHRFPELGLTVTSLAHTEGISVEHLCRLFHDHLGRSPLAQLNSLRLEEAKRQLTKTNLPIYTIARDCGYSTTSHLDRHFLRQNGCSPREYRLRAAKSPMTVPHVAR